MDHNTSSTTSQSSFHGTVISLVQHPSDSHLEIPREVDSFDPNINKSYSKTISHLPPSYGEVQPLAMPNGNLLAPVVPRESFTPSDCFCASQYDEKDWLNKTQDLVILKSLCLALRIELLSLRSLMTCLRL